MSMNEWNEARGRLSKAEDYTGKIGKAQRTTAKAQGKVHSVSVSTKIHYQHSDGDANYHECRDFDIALSTAIKAKFPELMSDALLLMGADVAKTGIAARESVEAMLSQIDQYYA